MALALTNTEEHLLVHYIRLNPKETYIELKEAYSLSIKKATIRKILAEYYITN